MHFMMVAMHDQGVRPAGTPGKDPAFQLGHSRNTIMAWLTIASICACARTTLQVSRVEHDTTNCMSGCFAFVPTQCHHIGGWMLDDAGVLQTPHPQL